MKLHIQSLRPHLQCYFHTCAFHMAWHKWLTCDVCVVICNGHLVDWVHEVRSEFATSYYYKICNKPLPVIFTSVITSSKEILVHNTHLDFNKTEIWEMQLYVKWAICKVKKHGYHGIHSDGVTILYNSPIWNIWFKISCSHHSARVLLKILLCRVINYLTCDHHS